MNQISKRLLALVLACSMTFGIASPVWAAESSADESTASASEEETGSAMRDFLDLGGETEGEQSDSQDSSSSSAQETDPADGETTEPSSDAETDPADSGSAETDPADGSASAPTETDPADASDPEADSSEEELEPEATSIGNLTMEYDDRYTVDDIEENDDLDVELDGYSIDSVATIAVSSYQVSKGKKTASKDTAAVEKTSDSEMIAAGIGTATVTLTNGTNTITYTVTVEPATLTIMFLAGQSNMEGYCSQYNFDKEEVVACEPGTVYSSYGGLGKDVRTKERTQQISGIEEDDDPPYLSASGDKSDSTGKSAAELIAGSLTSSESVSGETMAYQLDKLTSDESSRKNGLDAGLAYRWNKLTGDKVWVVNAAVGGSAIARWNPDSSDSTLYDRALAFFQQARDVYEAEISAGHYTAGDQLLFWLQGEANSGATPSSYRKQFRAMASAYKSELSLKAVGIIMVRSCVDEEEVGAIDLQMTGPRRAQYGFSSSTADSTDQFIYVVSNANEQWTTDSGVESYFKAKYGSKLNYPTGVTSNGNLKYRSISTSVKEVKKDLHYTQQGHNENGVTAAEGMYEALYNGGGTPSSVTWANAAGTAVKKISVGQGETAVAVAEVDPITSAKNVTIQADGTYCSYDAATGTVTGKKVGQGWIKVTYGETTLGTLTVNVILATPTLSTSSNLAGGIKIKWTKVSKADGYQIWRKTGTGKWSKIDTVSGGSTVTYTDTSVKSKNGTVYTYTVRATNSSHSDWRSGYDSTGLEITRLTAVKLTKVSNKSKKKLYAAWGKNSKCGGYELQYSTSSNFSSKKTVTISDSDTVKKTVSGLKKGKTYYVRVRCYKKTSGVTSYSAWSNTLKVKIKK